MSKQDRVYPRTPEDINRRYMQRIKDLEERVEQLTKDVEQLKAKQSS